MFKSSGDAVAAARGWFRAVKAWVAPLAAPAALAAADAVGASAAPLAPTAAGREGRGGRGWGRRRAFRAQWEARAEPMPLMGLPLALVPMPR